MSKTLTELLAWTENVNAKSSAKTKKLQKHLMDAIRQKVIVEELKPSPPMSISEPVNLAVETMSGVASRRHFIGSEEIRFAGISVTARTYKIMLEFTTEYASDIKVLKIPLSQALNIVSGFEIRMLAAGMDKTAERAFELCTELTVKQVDRTGSRYDAIGYGSW